jgi:predicted kinase
MDLTAISSSDIIMLGGLYGSGKSSFAKKYFYGKGRFRVSRLEIRKHIYEMAHFGDIWTGDKFSEEDDALVKHVERKIVEQYLHNKRKILLVNTFMSVKSRAGFLSIAKDTSHSISVIFLDTPLEKCNAQNNEKQTGVPSRVIYDLNFKKELPTTKEGFSKVMIINDYVLG